METIIKTWAEKQTNIFVSCKNLSVSLKLSLTINLTIFAKHLATTMTKSALPRGPPDKKDPQDQTPLKFSKNLILYLQFGHKEGELKFKLG